MAKMVQSTQMKNLSSVSVQHIPQVKRQIKTRLPVLNATEIRRHRVPYHESTVLELHEAGCHEAAEYFKFLYDLDEEARQIAGPNTVIWNKPRLKDNNELIDHLRGVLTIFCQRTEPAEKRTLALMESALYIETLTWEWWWIAETLYRSAFWIAKEIESNDKQIVTILRYTYARFLFSHMNNAKAALEYIREAHRSSRDKPWNAGRLLGIKQESLFRECCALLLKTLVQIAQESRKSGEADVAVDSCRVGLNCAKESGHEEYVAEAQHELGKSLMAAGDVNEALKNFIKSLATYEKIPDPANICRAHNEIAMACKEIGEDKRVLEHLQKSKDSATLYQLPIKLAEAYYLTGEYYLTRDEPKKATPNLEQAFSLYTSNGAKKEANRARCLTGVSRGQEMMGAYMALIMRSVEGDVGATMKICRWKDRGEPFEGITINEVALARTYKDFLRI